MQIIARYHLEPVLGITGAVLGAAVVHKGTAVGSASLSGDNGVAVAVGCSIYCGVALVNRA